MAERTYYVVLNSSAGTAGATGITADDLKARFEQHGLSAIVDADRRIPLDKRIAKALASGAQVIVAAGGDGTVTALAQALAGTERILAILPLGTVNLLARDLHLPLDIDAAIATIGGLVARRIDVGEVNGQIFLHKVVVGFIPGVAAGRERIRGHANWGTKLAFLRYFFRRMARARRMAIAIETASGGTRVERVQAIAVSSNAYDEGFGHLFSRQRLDTGSLTLYVIKHFKFADFLRLTLGMLLGRWQQDEALKIESANTVSIGSHKAILKVMRDGEVESLQTPLEFKVRPLALSILAPQTDEAASEPTRLEVLSGE
jgi:diacylglycerol kinase family enzyme